MQDDDIQNNPVVLSKTKLKTSIARRYRSVYLSVVVSRVCKDFLCQAM